VLAPDGLYQMVGANIHDEDLLVIEECEDPLDGTIVVALLEGEKVTVKRLYRKNSHILLVAEIPEHKDIEVGRARDSGQGGCSYPQFLAIPNLLTGAKVTENYSR